MRWAAAAEEGEPVNITAETSDFALELILISIFGDDYESKLLSQGENPFAFLASDSTRDLSVVMKARNLRRLLLEIIEARRSAGNVETYDFLSMYMHATDKQGEPFTDDELLDELITLIVAGFETSANTLNWVWYLLAGHPDVEDKVIDESRRLVPAVSAVDADALAAMQYTQQVLEETLRLYPPVWLFTRRSREDDELDAFDVPDDTDIYLSPFILHRTAEFWPDPERFDPDRFAEGRLPKNERPYFPFSLGPRRCLGEYFSFLEMKVHLGLLLPRFRMIRVDEKDPGPRTRRQPAFGVRHLAATGNKESMKLYATMTELLDDAAQQGPPDPVHRRRKRRDRSRLRRTVGARARFAGLAAGARHAARRRAGHLLEVEPEFRGCLLGGDARRHRAGAGGRRHQRRTSLQAVPDPVAARTRHAVHRDGPAAAPARIREVAGAGRRHGDPRIADPC